jgi:hypothetical protein
MKSRPRTIGLWQISVLGTLFSLWFGLVGLFVIAHGNLEVFLLETFPNSMRDAFYDLNRVLLFFWLVHSSLCLTALAASRSGRSDVLAILLIGPALGLTISLLSQRWEDPSWAVFVGVSSVGWLAGTIVTGAYWFMRSFSGKPPAEWDD